MSPSKSTKEPTKSSKVPSDVAMMPVERKTQHSGPTTGDEMFSKMDAFRKEFEENAKKMHKSSMTFNQTQVYYFQITSWTNSSGITKCQQ